jgi:hypothetical protein
MTTTRQETSSYQSVTIGQGSTVHVGYFVGENTTGSLCNAFASERSRVRLTDAEAVCPRCQKVLAQGANRAQGVRVVTR